MAIKFDYVARETGHSLKRNFTLSLASMLTVAVSLALVGSAFVVRAAVQHSTARWTGDVQFIVFMKPDASAAQIGAVRNALDPDNNTQIAKVTFFDKKRAYAEFREVFRDDPVLLSTSRRADMPTSFRVKPAIKNAELINQMGQQLKQAPGVYTVEFAYDTVKQIERVSKLISTVILATALFLLAAAGLLILNSIRMAMFARRREIEVMKLVGATNWFIRVPFMFEGLIQGLIGALPAAVAVWFLGTRINHSGGTNSSVAILQGLYVSSGEVWSVIVAMIVIGCLVGVVGSAVAVTRFLDV
jgi:cell division transport system permease protein